MGTLNTNNGEEVSLSEFPATDSPPKWSAKLAHSGTQVVTTKDPRKPHYHVGHLSADVEGEHGRYEVTKALESWLLGGPEPWWMDHLHRKNADTVTLPTGCDIRATGPMIDCAEPPSWGYWREDQSDDAQIARGLLADALCKKQRPT